MNQIPVEAAVNKTEVEAYKERLNKRQKCDPKATNSNEQEVEVEEEEIKPVVPLSACLARLAADETLPDYRSPATGKAGPALKHVRLGNFPRYLLVQLRRCENGDGWWCCCCCVRRVSLVATCTFFFFFFLFP